MSFVSATPPAVSSGESATLRLPLSIINGDVLYIYAETPQPPSSKATSGCGWVISRRVHSMICKPTARRSWLFFVRKYEKAHHRDKHVFQSRIVIQNDCDHPYIAQGTYSPAKDVLPSNKLLPGRV